MGCNLGYFKMAMNAFIINRDSKIIGKTVLLSDNITITTYIDIYTNTFIGGFIMIL